ncbi:MAG TPA: hypothetical protein VFV02_11930 [Acidimicrobiales bacterium]|nr:hypothetical protein [Acidimicrobiales bacterium]
MRWVLAAAFTAFAAVGCASSHAGRSVATTTTTPTVTTSTVAPTTSTTAWAATSAQPSPDAAAARLVSAWSSGNRGAAIAVASPQAVDTLFAQPYPVGYLQSRGCTAGANPATCTYRNTKTDGIYEIGVTSGPTGWYVSSVTPET